MIRPETQNIILAVKDYVIDKMNISNNIALFLLESYNFFDNKIFSSKKYNYKHKIKEFIKNESANSIAQDYIFYEIVSIMLIYHETRTYPKKMKIKYDDFIIAVQNAYDNDLKSIIKVTEQFSLEDIEKNTPNWFFSVYSALYNLSKRDKNISEAAIITLVVFIYYIVFCN